MAETAAKPLSPQTQAIVGEMLSNLAANKSPEAADALDRERAEACKKVQPITGPAHPLPELDDAGGDA